MYSKKNSQNPDVPFYVVPGRRKSSAEIIKAAKEEVVKMAAKRPTTPYTRSSSVTESPMNDSRPASSISWVSYASESPRKRPLSSIRLKPLRAKSASYREPIEKLHLEPTVIKSSISDRRLNSKIMSTNGSSSCEGSSVLSEPDILTTTYNSEPDDQLQISSENEVNVEGIDKVQTLTESIALDNLLIGVEHVAQVDIDTKHTDFESAVKKLICVLEKTAISGRKKNEPSVLVTVNQIRELMEKHNMMKQPFDNQFRLLKILFRLLNSKFPTLSLQISKLVLDIGVTEKNLSNIFKLLYKVCHTEKHIVEFLSCDVLGSFIEAMKAAELIDNFEALKYGTSLICLLSTKDLLLDVLSVFKCHDVLLQQLIQLNNMEKLDKDEEYSYIIIKTVTAIRYLSENEVIWTSVLSNGTIPETMTTLTLYGKNVQIAITTIRLLSKIADCSEGCNTILEMPDASEIFVKILELHKTQPFILLQAIFIIGNILTHDKDTAPKFYRHPELLDILYGVLDNFVLEQIELARMSDSCIQAGLLGAGDNGENSENHVDLVMKVIRVLANMCLSEEVGPFLAENEKAVHFVLKIINLYKAINSDSAFGPATCALLALNNITYFIQQESEKTPLYKEVFETILPLLGISYQTDIRIGACNIVQNLARLPQIRMFVFRNGLISAFMSLLDQHEHDIAFCGYSIILNLLTDKSVRTPFYKEQGITKLLHKLHLCLGRDWSTATLLCQILWNFCAMEENDNRDDDADDNKPLTHLEIQHLIKVLMYSTGPSAILKSDNENVKTIWEEQFCPTAKKLLNHLQS